MPAAAPNISHVTLPVRPAVCCRPKIACTACTTCTSSARAQVLHGSCTDLAQVLHKFCTGFARGAQGSGRPVQYRGGAKSAYSPLTHIKSGAHRRPFSPPHGSAVPPLFCSTALLLHFPPCQAATLYQGRAVHCPKAPSPPKRPKGPCRRLFALPHAALSTALHASSFLTGGQSSPCAVHCVQYTVQSTQYTVQRVRRPAGRELCRLYMPTAAHRQGRRPAPRARRRRSSPRLTVSPSPRPAAPHARAIGQYRSVALLGCLLLMLVPALYLLVQPVHGVLQAAQLVDEPLFGCPLAI